MSDRPWLWEKAKDAADLHAKVNAALEPGKCYRVSDLPKSPDLPFVRWSKEAEITGPAPRADEEQVGGDHYKAMDITPWQVIDTWPKEQRIGAYRAGLLKYTMRLGSKDDQGLEAGKAAHYAKKLLETLEKP